jgi:hypothetical protein
MNGKMNSKKDNNDNRNKHNGSNGHSLQPKLINGKVWVAEEGLPGGHIQLTEDDPRYRETRLWLDHNQRFIDMLDWVYGRNNNNNNNNNNKSSRNGKHAAAAA